MDVLFVPVALVEELLAHATALLPDGSVSDASVSDTLAIRGVIVDAPAMSQATAQTFRAIERVVEEEEL